MSFCICLGGVLLAQDQQLSDSLAVIYERGNYAKSEELRLLRDLAQYETDADKILNYSLQLIARATAVDSVRYEFNGYLRQGDAYRLKSELTKSLESYLNAAKIATEHKLKAEEASINITIADVYSIMGNGAIAVKYYKQALALINPERDALTLASAQLNLGDEYYNQEKLDSALYYFNESGRIFRAAEYEIGVAYNLGNVGLVYAEKGEHQQAEENLNQAIAMLERLGDYYPICVYLSAMSDVYDAKGEKEKSLEYALQSLQLAEKHELKEQISDSNLKLSNIYEHYGEHQKALAHYRAHVAFRDQVTSIQDVQDMANFRTEYEVSQKQMEVDLLNQQKKIQRYIVIGIGITLLLIGLLAFSLFKRNQFMKKTNEIIAYEKQRSDDLLKNILPEETAKELKENGAVTAKEFSQVSVLFTDFKNFTKQSENLAPDFLVKSIDYYFSKFDEIIEEYGLEKIKTIGDSYMCAGGLPFKEADHTARTCQAALDIVEFVKKTKRSAQHQLAKFDIRVGIHTGTVIAGVVGTKKFQYDIWGDTVNTASRMESSSEVGKVNISESTYSHLKDYDVFKFTPRGTIDAKGKGKIDMYFVAYAE
ncbi:MAG: adenylate/guanylate cyclase domain-containing protein [Bacteroidota bacterium]